MTGFALHALRVQEPCVRVYSPMGVFERRNSLLCKAQGEPSSMTIAQMFEGVTRTLHDALEVVDMVEVRDQPRDPDQQWDR